MSIKDTKVLTKRRGATIKRPKRKTTKRPMASSLGAWLFSGVLIGCVVSGGLFFMLSNKQDSAPSVVSARAEPTSKTSTPKRKKITIPEPSKPRFDFYTVLPKSNAQQSSPKTKSAKNTTTPRETSSRRSPPISHHQAQYLIQAGSFKKLADADELRAKLTLLGFEPEISKVQLKNHELWYRVIVGPFQTADNAYAEQQKLEDNHLFGTLVLKQQS